MIKSGFNKRLLFRPFLDGFPQRGFTAAIIPAAHHQTQAHPTSGFSEIFPAKNRSAANFSNFRFLTSPFSGDGSRTKLPVFDASKTEGRI
jgi:hypothetical protein